MPTGFSLSLPFCPYIGVGGGSISYHLWTKKLSSDFFSISNTIGNIYNLAWVRLKFNVLRVENLVERQDWFVTKTFPRIDFCNISEQPALIAYPALFLGGKYQSKHSRWNGYLQVLQILHRLTPEELFQIHCNKPLPWGTFWGLTNKMKLKALLKRRPPPSQALSAPEKIFISYFLIETVSERIAVWVTLCELHHTMSHCITPWHYVTLCHTMSHFVTLCHTVTATFSAEMILVCCWLLPPLWYARKADPRILCRDKYQTQGTTIPLRRYRKNDRIATSG